MRWTNKTCPAATAGQPFGVVHARRHFGWVAQATRLCRSATRRPEPGATDFRSETAFLPEVALDLPPGQWPGGTGQSPVPPKNHDICWLAGLLLLSAALAAPAADWTNSVPATLLLRNGDSLKGNLLSMDERQVVRWKHPDVAEPVELKLDSISQLNLRPPAPPDRGTNYPCKVSLAQGDALEGSLVSCDKDTLVLQTWYAGPLSIPRNQVQAISFFPTTPDLFAAPGPDGWTQGSVRGALGPAAGRWTFRNGAFYADDSASIGRDIKLPDAAELEFDLAWTGDFGLSVALYTDSLQPLLIADKDKVPDFAGFYSMVFRSSIVQVARIKKMENLTYLSPVFIPAASQTNRIHIDIRARKHSNTLALAVDGQLLQVWDDTNGFVGEGTGVRFVHNGSGPVKVSNLRLTPWNGLLGTNQNSTTVPGQDAAWLTNETTLSGAIESLAEGKLTLRANQDSVEIPLERVRRLAFAAPQAGPARELPGTVHAIFARGGPLTFQLES